MFSRGLTREYPGMSKAAPINPDTVLCASMALPDAAEGSVPEWVQLTPVLNGEIATFDGRGPYQMQDAAAVIAASRYLRSAVSQRTDDFESGRITPIVPPSPAAPDEVAVLSPVAVEPAVAAVVAVEPDEPLSSLPHAARRNVPTIARHVARANRLFITMTSPCVHRRVDAASTHSTNRRMNKT